MQPVTGVCKPWRPFRWGDVAAVVTALAVSGRSGGEVAPSDTEVQGDDAVCGGKNRGTSLSPDDVCDRRTEEKCLEHSDCHPIYAGPSGCDERVYAACGPSRGECGDAETLASPPDGAGGCWLFPTTCVPYSWGICD